MKNHNLTLDVQYEEPYMIQGKRLPRLRPKKGKMDVTIPTYTAKDIPIAFKVKTLWEEKKYYYMNGKYYVAKSASQYHYEPYTFQQYLHDVQYDAAHIIPRTRIYNEHLTVNSAFACYYDWCRRRILSEINNHLAINGNMYTQIGEPVYRLNSFMTYRNINICLDHIKDKEYIDPKIHFNALERKLAIETAKEIALKRGNRNILGIGYNCNIRVYMPELVTRIERGESEVIHG